MKNFEMVDRRDKQDQYGRIVYMCQSGGYVMAKRPRARPVVFTLKEWAKLERYERPAVPVQVPDMPR